MEQYELLDPLIRGTRTRVALLLVLLRDLLRQWTMDDDSDRQCTTNMNAGSRSFEHGIFTYPWLATA